MSHFATSSAALSRKLRQFVDTEIIPKEGILARGDNLARELTLDLTRRAQQAGLFGSFYPMHRGGRIASLVEYLSVAEQEGRSEYGPGIFGADATLDAYMLSHHGSANVKQRFLTPLLKGDAVSSYAMSEPDSIGSIPATMQCQARLKDGQWHVNGRNRNIEFLCRACELRCWCLFFCIQRRGRVAFTCEHIGRIDARLPQTAKDQAPARQAATQNRMGAKAAQRCEDVIAHCRAILGARKATAPGPARQSLLRRLACDHLIQDLDRRLQAGRRGHAPAPIITDAVTMLPIKITRSGSSGFRV